MNIDPKWNPRHLKEIVVLGQTIAIKHRKPKKESHGECDIDRRTIELNNNLRGEFAMRVLIHEAVHAAIRLCGVDYHISEATEEQICTVMESLVPELIVSLGPEMEEDDG